MNATRDPSGETRGEEALVSAAVSARGSNAPVAETIHRRVRPSFFSRSNVVTGTTAQVPSGPGAGAPTRGMPHRSSAVKARPPGRAAGCTVVMGRVETGMRVSAGGAWRNG